jgi:hypothetical protein
MTAISLRNNRNPKLARLREEGRQLSYVGSGIADSRPSVFEMRQIT